MDTDRLIESKIKKILEKDELTEEDLKFLILFRKKKKPMDGILDKIPEILGGFLSE